MRGRLPVGPEYVEKLHGSTLAKERMRAVLETMLGELRLQDACERLDICEQRFHQVRQEAMQAALTAIEPGRPGRPAAVTTPAEEALRALEMRVAELERELCAATAREEIAIVLPRLVHTSPGQEEAESPKKNAGAGHASRRGPRRLDRGRTRETPDRALSTSITPAHTKRPMWPGPTRLQSCAATLSICSSGTSSKALSLPQTAELLGVSERTLRQWQYDFRTATLKAQSLGRPLLRASRQKRNAVIELLDELGPLTSVPTLQDCFPTMARAELTELVQRYRRVWQRRHLQDQHILRWPVPGIVWAMDFAEPPAPIDGLYPYLLAVRDLSSGQQLLWLPVSAADAEQTIAALDALFHTWGAPLVLKSDNGSPFCAGATLDFLSTWGVIPLFSPPYTPEYNGSIEAGNGSLKTRTECQATAHGRPAAWTCADVAAARTQANATSRPRGAAGPTAEQLWQARSHLTAGRRAAFQAAVNVQRDAARLEADWPLVGPVTERAARALDRQAIRRALVEHGFLLFRRRRIPLPFPKPKPAVIR